MTIVANVFKAFVKALAYGYAFLILMLVGLILITNAMLHFVG